MGEVGGHPSLGDAGRDNALLVTVETGQAVSRLLFDCGEGCLNSLPFSDVRANDHLCFFHTTRLTYRVAFIEQKRRGPGVAGPSACEAR